MDIHSTENHVADENEITEPEGTRIGAPASIEIRNFSSKQNKVKNLPNANIG
jgi:hypothetical protein